MYMLQPGEAAIKAPLLVNSKAQDLTSPRAIIISDFNLRHMQVGTLTQFDQLSIPFKSTIVSHNNIVYLVLLQYDSKQVRLAPCCLKLGTSKTTNPLDSWKNEPAESQHPGRSAPFFTHLVTLCDLQSPVILVASLFIVVRPGAPSSVLAPSSDALCS